MPRQLFRHQRRLATVKGGLHESAGAIGALTAAKLSPQAQGDRPIDGFAPRPASKFTGLGQWKRRETLGEHDLLRDPEEGAFTKHASPEYGGRED
jgi:hypothetical protein